MDTIANLQLGMFYFLEFAEGVGAITQEENQLLFDLCRGALFKNIAEQVLQQASSDSAERFIELLSSVLASGRAHLSASSGGIPTDSRLWGWESAQPRGRCIGWVDDDGVYLDPESSHAAIQRLASEIGEPLGVSSLTMRKRLRDAGLLKSVEKSRDRLTVRKTVEGSRRKVLHLGISSLIDPSESPTQGIDRIIEKYQHVEEYLTRLEENEKRWELLQRQEKWRRK